MFNQSLRLLVAAGWLRRLFRSQWAFSYSADIIEPSREQLFPRKERIAPTKKTPDRARREPRFRTYPTLKQPRVCSPICVLEFDSGAETKRKTQATQERFGRMEVTTSVHHTRRRCPIFKAALEAENSVIRGL